MLTRALCVAQACAGLWLAVAPDPWPGVALASVALLCLTVLSLPLD